MLYSVSIDKQPSGQISLKSNFSEPIILNNIGEEKIITIQDVSGLLSLNDLITDFSGENNSRKLKMFFRISTTERPDKWSEWVSLDPIGESNCFPELTPFYDYNIEIKFNRTGGNDNDQIIINGVSWDGQWNVNTIDSAVVDISPSTPSVIFDVPDTYKVFRLDGYELVSRNSIDLNVEYRISQNNKRSWSDWTILTDANIKTHHIDPIRFFNIQYKFTHTGSSGTIQIRDLNFYGEFINITQNYQKSNAFGLSEDCKNGTIGDGVLETGQGSGTGLMISNGLNTSSAIWSSMSCDKDSLFDPYKLTEAVDLFDKLSNDATSIGGWSVEYFRTEPDENGIDHSIHEYSLHGVVSTGDVKIMVPDNQFPSNQVAFNQFDLALLESFEVHLTKSEFKSVFGNQYRPRKEDFLYFCDLRRMYRIEHAQAIRDFGNAAVYYKLILGKYNQRADVKSTTTSIQEKISGIVKNSSLEDLFGTDKHEDKKEVANKEQFETLSQTHERTRNEISAKIEKDLIDNAELVLSKYHYNLSGIDVNKSAVTYKSSDIYLQEGKNRSFITWFKFIDYSDSDVYNLLNNYNDDLNKGYKFDIKEGVLVTTINNSIYELNISDNLDDDVWYCVLVNIDQRQRKISNYLYKRNVDREIDAKNLDSTKLRLLSSNQLDYTPNKFELTPSDLEMRITGSLMRITNIRVFNDIIPDDQHTKILNQQIIRDTDYSILADNSNKIYYVPNYPYL